MAEEVCKCSSDGNDESKIQNTKFTITDKTRPDNASLHKIAGIVHSDTIDEYYTKIKHEMRKIEGYHNYCPGYVEKESNLSRLGFCFVYDDAAIYDDAQVSDNAIVVDHSSVYGHAKVHGDAVVLNIAEVTDYAEIFGKARIGGNAEIRDYAQVFNNARVNDAHICDRAVIGDNACISGDDIMIFGNAQVSGNANIGKYGYISKTTDYLCVGPIGSREEYTTFYRTKDRGIYVCCGCFNNSIEAFEKKVKESYKDNSILYHNQYLLAIEYAKSTLSIL